MMLLICAAIAIAFGPGGTNGFDLREPDQVIELPEELTEISALTDVDDRTVACLHDEAARLYFIDLHSGKVVREMAFGAPGDMEGLTRVGEEYFALRSDGLMFRMHVERNELAVTDTFRLDLPNRNIEGLGWDEKRKLVLISPKDVPKGGKKQRDVRMIHCYDPATKRLCDRPVLQLSIGSIIEEARRKDLKVPMKRTDNGRLVPDMKLKFSSVAVDPVTDHYFLLSAVDRILLIVDRRGEVMALEQLDPKLFEKPEGITFLRNGDLLISNEGKGKKANILRFERKGQ